ncbi:MAG: adenylate/guanylate cyclase domain-containing protein [Acidobacteria bacterium]|nr:adenylate/guanylate cyclase domain-containing protein [Acidobacteriota bacterium]
MDHQRGQYRAELFDEMIARLLTALYSQAHITRGIALRIPHKGAFRSVSIDFQVGLAAGDIVVETTAPYTDAVADVINSALRRLKTIIELLTPGDIKTVILATPTSFPHASYGVLEETRRAAAAAGVTVKIWDADELLKLVREHFSTNLTSFSVDELKSLPGLRADAAPAVAPLGELEEGMRDDVVVLVADFCSYSRFVQASGADTSLVASLMARFYRETRQAVKDGCGILDQHMGDGILAYWFGQDSGAQLESCLKRLMGIAVNLADEWQEQVDYLVEPKGLRAGAAIGSVMFVSEQPLNPTIHAIGDAVNIAARLQAEAEPNSLVISNKLRKRFFGAEVDFEEAGPFNLKNIGSVIAWRKSFGEKDA